MDREQSIALWQKGKEEWNAWANKMLAQRDVVEKARDDRSVKLQDWLAEARVDFSRRRFAPSVVGQIIEFEDFIFPWTVMFEDTQFQGEARFRGARFRGPVGFLGTQFQGETSFAGAEFHGPAGFLQAQFDREAWFTDARFYKWDQFLSAQIKPRDYRFRGAAFNGATFQNAAFFDYVEFKEAASFQKTQFLGLAYFSSVEFSNDVFFANANFGAFASFEKAVFLAKEKPCYVDFTGMTASQGFKLLGAKFHEVPAFNQADFKQPPDLDNEFPLLGACLNNRRISLGDEMRVGFCLCP